MIDPFALNILRANPAISTRERQLTDSHLEAWNEIWLLRKTLEDVLAALDHIDGGSWDQAVALIEGINNG